MNRRELLVGAAAGVVVGKALPLTVFIEEAAILPTATWRMIHEGNPIGNSWARDAFVDDVTWFNNVPIKTVESLIK